MQNKFINKERLDEYLSLGKDVVFLDTSPTKDITFPPKTIVAAFHFDKAVGARSTLYIMRHDPNDTTLLNTDAYSFQYPSSGDKISLYGPFKPQEDHHNDFIPSVLGSLPSKHLNRLTQIEDGNLSDSNFLS